MHKIKQPLIHSRGQSCQGFHYLTTKSVLELYANKLACQHIIISYSRMGNHVRFSLTLLLSGFCVTLIENVQSLSLRSVSWDINWLSAAE